MNDELRFKQARTDWEAINVCVELVDHEEDGRSDEMRELCNKVLSSTEPFYLRCMDLPNDFLVYMRINKFLKPEDILKPHCIYKMDGITLYALAYDLYQWYSFKARTILKQLDNVEVLQQLGNPEKAVAMYVHRHAIDDSIYWEVK